MVSKLFSILIFPVLISFGIFGLIYLKNTPSLARSDVYIAINDGGAHGSGVQIKKGYVLTAAHVADPDLKEMNSTTKPTLTVIDSKGIKHKTEVLWSNHDYDVSLLKIDDPDTINISALSCRNLERGENIIMAGNPINLKDITTYGQVANPDSISWGPWKSVNSISGPIIPGMSGGPAYDSIGEVVGINVGTPATQIENKLVQLPISFIVPGKSICTLMNK